MIDGQGINIRLLLRVTLLWNMRIFIRGVSVVVYLSYDLCSLMGLVLTGRVKEGWSR